MNDRFKFRVWYKRKNTYIKDFVFNFVNKVLHITEDYFTNEYEYTHTFEEDEIIIEQCTGLKDKNGKLIYEGDWLKTKGGYYCYVAWFDGFWWVKSLPSEAMDLEHAEFYKECEVVGNIHENADLLELKQDE